MQELENDIECDEPTRMTIRKLQERNESLLREIDQVHSMLKRQEADIGEAWTILINREAELARTKSILINWEAELDLLRRKGKAISIELDLFKNRKTIRWLNRFFDKSDSSKYIPSAFLQLKDDSLIFTKNLTGFRLQSSINLERVPFLLYPLDLDRPNLKGILLAPVLDLPLTRGLLAIEIISPENTIVSQSFIPTVQINDCEPTCFEFSPISNTDQGRFWLRVFVREIDGPLRIFEWRKYPILGLGPLRTRAFCGFQFEIGQ